MKKLNTARLLSLLLSIILTVSLCGPALAYEGQFSDVPSSHWAYSEIMECASSGAVAGFSDGTFKPNDNVSYAQFIAMITRAFYGNEVNAVIDTDGKPWYYPNMQVARENELDWKTNIKNNGGWPVVTVADSPINRYEMAMVIYNLINNKDSANITEIAAAEAAGVPTTLKSITPTQEEKEAAKKSISDFSQIPKIDAQQAYIVAVPTCYAAGILAGMSDGTFSGNSNMTRAQACVVLNRLKTVLNGGTLPTPSPATQPSTDKKLANGKDITTENVQEILDQIKSEYPDGTSWTSKEIDPNTKYYEAGKDSIDVKYALWRYTALNGGRTSTQYACGGWATMVSDRIFGQSGFPAREVSSLADVRIGDIVIYFNSSGQLRHVAIVARISGPYEFNTLSGGTKTGWKFDTCDGNWGNIAYNDRLGKTWRIFTRYPE